MSFIVPFIGVVLLLFSELMMPNLANAAARVKLNHESQTITVVTHITYYGPMANLRTAELAQDEIARYWSGRTNSWLDDPTPYYVMIEGKPYQFKIWVPYSVKKLNEIDSEIEARSKQDKNPENLYVRLEQGGEHARSYVEGVFGNRGTWYISDQLGRSTTAAHEFGHMLGLEHSPSYWVHQGQPGIMAARGTYVQKQYQWDPNAEMGAPGGTINPYKRRVIQVEIDQLKLDRLKYDENGWAELKKLEFFDIKEGDDWAVLQKRMQQIFHQQLMGSEK